MRNWQANGIVKTTATKVQEQRGNEITGVHRDNKSAESGSMGATEEADELALIEEAITESERDIAEATDLLAGTETKTEEARNENVINPALQVPKVEHTYNLRQRKHPRPDYTNRYVFQATIGHHRSRTGYRGSD